MVPLFELIWAIATFASSMSGQNLLIDFHLIGAVTTNSADIVISVRKFH